jgi:tRNA A37 threonylcarbamoyladenosine biosynthesis protein TsaE
MPAFTDDYFSEKLSYLEICKMAEISEQNRWGKEINQFLEVLENPTGQAIVIVGPAGSGKSTLLRNMVMIAEKGVKFHVEGKIYHVGSNDNPNNVLREIGRWPSGSVAYLEAEEILRGLSSSVEEFGELHRRVIGIDADHTQPTALLRSWLEIIPKLPDKVKFIFTQRPNDILVTNEHIMGLPNVVRIDIEPPQSLDEGDKEESEENNRDADKIVGELIDAQKELLERFREVLVERKGVPIDSLSITRVPFDVGRIVYLDLLSIRADDKVLAVIGYYFGIDAEHIERENKLLLRYKEQTKFSNYPLYIACLAPDEGERLVDIYEVSDQEKPHLISLDNFPSYEELQKNMEHKMEAFEDEDNGGEKIEAPVSENINEQDSVTVEIVEKSRPWEMSTSLYAIGDGEAEKDTLGFKPYIEAVAEFLVHEDTKPPLTISIEGEWGSGKSSFMRQLQKEIRRIYTEQDKGTCFIVEFDPWRHDKDEAMWAAFVLKFIKDSARSLKKWEKCVANYDLWKQRFQWKNAWPDLIRLILISVIWILSTVAITIGLWKGIQLGAAGTVILPKWIGSFIAVAVSGWVAFGKVKDFCGSPLSVDLKKYMKRPDYVSKISFIERFHKDFEKIVHSYAKNKRVYVFIDDLDRCEIPKAAELMESINLMLSDNTKLVFIMGMDREKVAAGLAVKHEKLLPYLSGLPVSKDDSDKNTVKRKGGIWYGYSFIEKFIQIPFVLPTPNRNEINNMLLDMGETEKRIETIHDKPEQKKTEVLETENSLAPEEKMPYQEMDEGEKIPYQEMEEKERAKRKETRKEVMLKFEGDNKNFRDVVLMVSEALGNNPRRVKQFVNLYRLRIRTAASTGLITQEESRFTFAQLGKFVGIGLGWPLFIRDLEKNHKLLDELVDIAEGEQNPDEIYDKAEEWAEDRRLVGLIKSGCFDVKNKKQEGDEYERFCMRGLDIEKLLKISPRIIQGEIEQTENLKGEEVA